MIPLEDAFAEHADESLRIAEEAWDSDARFATFSYVCRRSTGCSGS